MKRIIIVSIFIGLVFSSFSQSNWHAIQKNEASDFGPKLLSSGGGEIIVEFSLDGFQITSVNAPVVNSKIISIPRTGRISVAGDPDLVQLTAPLIIPDLASMEIIVLESEYFDIPNIEIAPSKGDFSRQIDPESIPYTYGPAYQQNAWYPGKLAELSDPHIFRDFRGIVAMTYPFQYNPVTKVLRIYNKIVVKIKESKSAAAPVNPFYRDKAISSIAEDFHHMYKDRYVNYTPDKYNAPVERGRILVLCHDQFIPDMMPYVRWKNTIGFPTEIVGISTIGNTQAAILNLVTTYYNSPNKLTYLLIVGDNPQITTYNYGNATYSDNYFGYITGNDSYSEVIVGRFSATTSAHVQTQVQRTIEYEKATGMASGWQTTGIGIGANEGSGIGHDGGEADYVHINNIRTRLLAYNYSTVYQEYDQNVPGIPNTTASQISSRINGGATIINYCNHGSETGWSVAGYSVTHVNALTNVKKLPFIWAVACVNGQFTRTAGDCMAEAWLKATDSSGEPTGALATYMSTINQPWLPPMDAQDEFNRILCELIPGKIRRTFGAISTSGSMHMLDLGPTSSDRLNTARAWTIFGDPSIMLRTDYPLSMTVTHPSAIGNGATNLSVNCNVEDAFVTLTKNYEIIGTGIITGGIANINFPTVYAGDTVHIAVTAYNKIPYEADVLVMNPAFALDAEALNILQPTGIINCSGVQLQPRILIRNMGSATLTSFTLYYQLNADPEQSYAWTGSLPSLGVDTIALPSFITVTGNHTFKIRTTTPNGSPDQNPSNDQFERQFDVQDNPVTADFTANISESCVSPMTVQFTNNSQNAVSYLWNFGDGTTSTSQNPSHIYNSLGSFTVSLIANAGVCGSAIRTYGDMILIGAELPVASDVEHCGPASFTLTASAPGPISWFSDPAGTNLINTGTTYDTPMLNATTTYYLGTKIENHAFGGRPDTTGQGAFFTSNTAHGLVFNCISPSVLKSVKVYSNAASTVNRIIRLENSSGTLIQNVTVSVPPGESRVTLNLNIPVGTNLRLMGPTAPYLYRNGATGMNIGYPLAAGNNISIVRSTAGGAELNYYYYFYDWEVEEVCESALKPLIAHITTTPAASFSSNIYFGQVQFTSTGTGGNLTHAWDFGDGSTSADINPLHYYGAPGNYNVTLTVNNLCGIASTNQQVNITATNIDEAEIVFEMFPNPAADICRIISPEMMHEVSLTDIQGKQVLLIRPSDYSVLLDLSGLAQGLYNVRIITESGTSVKQLLVR
jgi:PKD repeat protein